MASSGGNSESAVVFYTTWPDTTAAERCGRDLLARRLAACVNIGPEITSLYHWRAAIESSRETVMLVKTVARQAESTRDAILALHPYETPCVLAFDASTATSSFAFLGWLSAEVA